MRDHLPRRFSRATIGARLGGFIYGTIIALGVLVGGARAYSDDAARIAALVAVSSAVLWLAHVYAHGLAHSVERDEHLSMAELRRIAARQGSIVEAALPPVGALLLGAFGVVSTTTAVWLAFGLGLAVLAAQGFVFARVERLGWPANIPGRRGEPQPRRGAGRPQGVPDALMSSRPAPPCATAVVA